MIYLVGSTGLLFALVFIEAWILRVVKKEDIPWKEILLNINSGHILLWVTRAWTLLGYYWVYDRLGGQWIAEWPFVWQWVFTFFAWDFCYYWSHRMHHEIPFLWNIHSVHHQGEHFSLSLGVRNSWFQTVTSFPFFSILPLIGVPLETFLAVSGIHYFIQFYNHNRLVGKSGWLEYVMITPAHHRVHHGCNDLYIDRNHGGTFVFWDKMFNTFQIERDDIPIEYGLKEKFNSYSPFWANVLPFLQYFGLDTESMGKPAAKGRPVPAWYLVTGGMLLIGLLLLYIQNEHSFPLDQLVFLFLIIFTGTLLIGSMAQEQRFGLTSWIGLAVLGSVVWYGLFGSVGLVLFGGLVMHGVVGVVLYFCSLSS